MTNYYVLIFAVISGCLQAFGQQEVFRIDSDKDMESTVISFDDNSFVIFTESFDKYGYPKKNTLTFYDTNHQKLNEFNIKYTCGLRTDYISAKYPVRFPGLRVHQPSKTIIFTLYMTTFIIPFNEEPKDVFTTGSLKGGFTIDSYIDGDNFIHMHFLELGKKILIEKYNFLTGETKTYLNKIETDYKFSQYSNLIGIVDGRPVLASILTNRSMIKSSIHILHLSFIDGAEITPIPIKSEEHPDIHFNQNEKHPGSDIAGTNVYSSLFSAPYMYFFYSSMESGKRYFAMMDSTFNISFTPYSGPIFITNLYNITTSIREINGETIYFYFQKNTKNSGLYGFNIDTENGEIESDYDIYIPGRHITADKYITILNTPEDLEPVIDDYLEYEASTVNVPETEHPQKNIFPLYRNGKITGIFEAKRDLSQSGSHYTIDLYE